MPEEPPTYSVAVWLGLGEGADPDAVLAALGRLLEVISATERSRPLLHGLPAFSSDPDPETGERALLLRWVGVGARDEFEAAIHVLSFTRELQPILPGIASDTLSLRVARE
jgi:hypothetical protein